MLRRKKERRLCFSLSRSVPQLWQKHILLPARSTVHSSDIYSFTLPWVCFFFFLCSHLLRAHLLAGASRPCCFWSAESWKSSWSQGESEEVGVSSRAPGGKRWGHLEKQVGSTWTNTEHHSSKIRGHILAGKICGFISNLLQQHKKKNSTISRILNACFKHWKKKYFLILLCCTIEM